jgi:hypothetical protein
MGVTVTSSPPPSSAASPGPRTLPKPRALPALTKAREEALTGLGGLTQVPLMAMGQLADAVTVGQHWPNVSREVAKLAETQEEIGRFIDPLIKVGPFAALITVTIPMVMQFLVNHKLMKAGVAGSVPPEALAAQMEAAMANAQLDALQQQLDAEKYAQDVRDQIAEQRERLLAEHGAQGEGE